MIKIGGGRGEICPPLEFCLRSDSKIYCIHAISLIVSCLTIGKCPCENRVILDILTAYTVRTPTLKAPSETLRSNQMSLYIQKLEDHTKRMRLIQKYPTRKILIKSI